MTSLVRLLNAYTMSGRCACIYAYNTYDATSKSSSYTNIVVYWYGAVSSVWYAAFRYPAVLCKRYIYWDYITMIQVERGQVSRMGHHTRTVSKHYVISDESKH